ASGQIGDGQFVQGLQYMIQHKIMQIPAHSGSIATSGTQQIPAWIKNNAGWWASGQIGDGQFVQGLQYMITNGIIKIST
ncbi:MAG: peptidase, partial [Thaumarchaeota archaeon]|nr:peptidase [Nitrososphaerota archaeon]